jgi:hypothetical protein
VTAMLVSRRRVWWMSGRRPREVLFVRRGGGHGNHREWWPYEVGLQLVMASVALLCRLCGGFVSSVGVP